MKHLVVSRLRSGQSIAALALLLVCGVVRAAAPPMSWSLSVPRLAVTGLREELNASPDDPDLHARLGVAWAKLGYFGEALASLQFALGSQGYERLGIGWHADALSALGRHAEAIALRRTQLSEPQSDLAELLTRVGLVDDLRALGDPRAEDEAWDLIAAFPAGPTAWAVMADVLMDQGDLHGAMTALALATPTRVSARVWQARARLARLEGDPDGAATLLREGMEQNLKATGIAEDLAELCLASSDPQGALDVLELPRFGTSERQASLSAFARSYAALGRWEEACPPYERLRDLYPRDPLRLPSCAALGFTEPSTPSGSAP